jgi:tetratricopeptide (TPR) repeat protein
MTIAEMDQLGFSSQEMNLVLMFMMRTASGDDITELDIVAEKLDLGGVLLPSSTLLMQHEIAYERCRSMKAREQNSDEIDSITPGVDDISGGNLCLQDESALKECVIEDLMQLPKGQAATGNILWVDIVTNSFAMAAITTIAKDADDTMITLSLYNMLNFRTAGIELINSIFGKGARIGIKNPYLKLSNSGDFTLRNDNPSNIVFANASLQTKIHNVIDNGTIEEQKIRGNASFKSKDYHQAVEEWSNALDDACNVVEALHSNLAQALLNTFDYAGALVECDAVLQTNPTHTKALYRKDQALHHLEAIERQKLGVYDFLTIPLVAEQQNSMKNYYGPVEVKFVPGKGRGLFLTRDVRPGELLFAEKAIAVHEKDIGVWTTNVETSSATKGSQVMLALSLTMAIQRDEQINAQLSTLTFDKQSSNLCIPDMDHFREDSFEPVPVLSAKSVSGIIEFNAFQYSHQDLSESERKVLNYGVSNLEVDGGESWIRFYRQQQTKLGAKIDAKELESGLSESNGTGIWVVTSFMNHRNKPNVLKEFYGKFVFARTNDFLEKGTELFISYSEQATTHWGF